MGCVNSIAINGDISGFEYVNMHMRIVIGDLVLLV